MAKKINPHTELLNITLIALHKELDGRFWQNNTGATKTAHGFIKFGLKGSTDILGLAYGRPFFIEIKTGSGRLTADQKAFRDMVVRYGGIHATIRSLDDVMQFCGRIKPRLLTELDSHIFGA